jgi:hypothetical protein
MKEKDFLDEVLEEFESTTEESRLDIKIPLSITDIIKEVFEKEEKKKDIIWLIHEARKELRDVNQDIKRWKIRYAILQKNYKNIKALDEDLLFLLTTLRAKVKEEEGKVSTALKEGGVSLDIIKDSLEEKKALFTGTDLGGQVSFVKGIADMLRPIADIRKEFLEKIGKKEIVTVPTTITEIAPKPEEKKEKEGKK